VYTKPERKQNENGTDCANRYATLQESRSLPWGLVFYTENVGGSNPSAPTIFSMI